MAATGGRGRRGKDGGRSRAAAPGRTRRPAPTRRSGPRDTGSAAPVTLPPGPFRLGAVEGATPGKWIDVWSQRLPEIPLELSRIGLADQRAALLGTTDAPAAVDAALIRLPVDTAGLHVIPLYEEVAVVVCAADSSLTAADELTLDDLAGEVVLAPRGAPAAPDVPGAIASRVGAPADVAEAIATVAAGVGVVIVPMSLARLHHRKDVAHRPLRDVPASPVALAWPAPDTSPLVEAFIGIVRGRTANSSR